MVQPLRKGLVKHSIEGDLGLNSEVKSEKAHKFSSHLQLICLN